MIIQAGYPHVNSFFTIFLAVACFSKMILHVIFRQLLSITLWCPRVRPAAVTRCHVCIQLSLTGAKKATAGVTAIASLQV
ncbi:MAG: hypothetical protein LBS21_12430 [Clostridiales bacterium]|jgi:hypothetical protein|nr:hypothetical protein [Clostridiales bacterium]